MSIILNLLPLLFLALLMFLFASKRKQIEYKRLTDDEKSQELKKYKIKLFIAFTTYSVFMILQYLLNKL